MKNLLAATIFTLLLTISSFAQVLTEKDFEIPANKKIETEYDKFEDETKVSLRLQLTATLSLTFSNTFSGQKQVSKPTKIRAMFVSLDSQQSYFSSRSWIVLADNERIRLGSGDYLSEGGGEVLGFSISIEDYKKIASAKKVEMQVGSRKLIFTESEINSLNLFYKALVP